jgi:hypothetical protein
MAAVLIWFGKSFLVEVRRHQNRLVWAVAHKPVAFCSKRIKGHSVQRVQNICYFPAIFLKLFISEAASTDQRMGSGTHVLRWEQN